MTSGSWRRNIYLRGHRVPRMNRTRPEPGKNKTSRLMEVAKEMIKESLPIKCLEAVILSLYPTDSFHNNLNINSFYLHLANHANMTRE